MVILNISLLLCLVCNGLGFIAFDCNNDMSEYQIIDTTSLGRCKTEYTNYTETEHEIQLLQTQEISDTEAYQCFISVDVQVRHCGMHSHISLVDGGDFNFVMVLTEAECKGMWADQAIKVLNNRVLGINRNGQTVTTIVVAGSLTSNGYCTTDKFTYQSKTWNDVVATARIDIKLYQYKATVHRTDDKITLRKGLECQFSKLTCFDSEEGQIFWNAVSTNVCYLSKFDVLYSGKATRQESQLNGEIQTVFSVQSSGQVFALMTVKSIDMCGMTIYATEHPKLFIAPKHGSSWFFKSGTKKAESVDMFTYMNSKFVYLERHIRHELELLYRNILEHRCATSKQIWYNQLSLLQTSPIDFAYAIKQSPGYMALVMGEIVYITKCSPVNVQVRQSSRCYQELPVNYNNKSYYMTPRHHLLTLTGTEVECSNILYPAYKVQGQWWGQTPSLVHVPDPDQINPNVHNTWKYKSSGDLITSGIYTTEDLEKYRRFLTNPNARQASITNLGSVIMGLDVDTRELNFQALVSDASLDYIIKSYMQRLWGGFVTFGEIISGCIGIYMIIRLFKFVIDTVLHGLTLYPIYGCSFYLVAALWDAVTTFVLRKADTRLEKNKDSVESEVPLDGQASAPLVTHSKDGQELQNMSHMQQEFNPKVAIYPRITEP